MVRADRHVAGHLVVEISQFSGRHVAQGGGHVRVGHLSLDAGRHRSTGWYQRLELACYLGNGVGRAGHHLAVQVVGHRAPRGRRGVPRGSDDHHLGIRRTRVIRRPDRERSLVPLLEDGVVHLHGPVLGP